MISRSFAWSQKSISFLLWGLKFLFMIFAIFLSYFLLWMGLAPTQAFVSMCRLLRGFFSWFRWVCMCEECCCGSVQSLSPKQRWMLLCDQTIRIMNNTCQWYTQELLFDPRWMSSTLTQIIATLSCSEEHSDPSHQVPLNRGLSYRSQSVVMLSRRVGKHLV